MGRTREEDEGDPTGKERVQLRVRRPPPVLGDSAFGLARVEPFVLSFRQRDESGGEIRAAPALEISGTEAALWYRVVVSTGAETRLLAPVRAITRYQNISFSLVPGFGINRCQFLIIGTGLSHDPVSKALLDTSRNWSRSKSTSYRCTRY